MKKAGNGVRADGDAEVAKRHGDFGGGTPGPLHAGDGISGRVVIEQKLDQGDDVGAFFSMSGRPPPDFRVPSRTTS